MTKLQPARGRVRINATGLIFPPDLCPEVSVVSDVQTTTQRMLVLQIYNNVSQLCLRQATERIIGSRLGEIGGEPIFHPR